MTHELLLPENPCIARAHTRRRLEVPPKEPRRQQHPVNPLARLADDAVEDSFKVLCLWSHAAIGELLRRNLHLDPRLQVRPGRHTPPCTAGLTCCWLASVAGQLLGRLVSLGVPAAKYNACNLYGDYLGDWTQYHLHALMDWVSSPRPRPLPRTRAPAPAPSAP